ncbi:hypothetical protein ABE61_12430 [Lysinibacillus sphaericus]|uniref:alcohol dehydrogenase catalytic domain-containing protein n=1 Tax=Lysinibacillus sphaericus TaxID=1421 RepID=UPI0018CE8F1A|nr:alcohol dehydrogenase catalytic domain-containing protein [Lysinibacillus sphaericus]MBG9454827.1 hypothetical protein [Lysinibacillus sphaericus]MBG9478255.1 hypothetical protein [Lysinibacillus sphaericus]MBG9590968.1 hypothetical protein [Lysinibacillus sphaericus]
MLSKSFKIIEPKRFEIYIEDIVPKKGEALIKIDYASICKADIRYYEGNRDERLLALKYPMSLIHEATGIVLRDPTGHYENGTRVVLVPNRVEANEPCDFCVCDNPQLGENYCPQAIFASSNSDGFSKESLAYPVDYLVKIPTTLSSRHAVFSEMISVVSAIIRSTKMPEQGTVAVWGDGILGYLVCATLRILYPQYRLIVFGKHEEKLKQFPVDAYYLTTDFAKENIVFAYECVGGKGSESAIQQILSQIQVGGTIILSGVTEDPIAIPTRKILEKGLTMKGVTRSRRQDFLKAIELLQNDDFLALIEVLIISESKITSIVDFYKAFEQEINNQVLGKHLMQFYI